MISQWSMLWVVGWVNAALAQLVEHWICNQNDINRGTPSLGGWDLGVGPRLRAIRRAFNPLNAALAQLVEHLICNQAVVGSSPMSGSNLQSGGLR